MEDPRWARFLEYLRRGHDRSDSARLARIPAVVLRNAVQLAKEGREDYLELFEDMKVAEAEAVDRYMGRLDKSAEAGDMRAIRFGLTALRPERFGERAQAAAASQAPAMVTDDAAKQQILELAIRLLAEDPKARATLTAALQGKDPPQLSEGEIIPEDDE